MEKFYSNGKLLVSGEYAVLDGARSLALPTKFGQSLEVSVLDSPVLIWESFNCDKELWFQAEIELTELTKEVIDPKLSTLKNILIAAQKLNADFLNNGKGAFVQTFLTFPNEWGLGTSSTLINNIADWAKVDSFKLLQNSFGGSGYDIACAQNDAPITYQLNKELPIVNIVSFKKKFLENIFFVYLNQKQDSKEGIQLYRNTTGDKAKFCSEISSITERIINSETVSEFESLLRVHEQCVGDFLGIVPIQQQLFQEFSGAVKSLGAWGGDFIMVTGNADTPTYFKERGFDTVIPYRDLIL